MKSHRFVLFSILAIFLVSALIDLPPIPVKFHWGKINIDKRIGGYRLDFELFGKRIQNNLELRRGLDLQGGVHVVLNADMEKIPAGDRSTALESARRVIERRVNFYGVSEANIQTSRAGNDYRLIVELPGVTDVSQALSVIGQTAQLDFRELSISANEATSAAFRADDFSITGLTGADLTRAYASFDQSNGAPEVSLEFSPEGGRKFEEITKRNVGKPLAIFLDNVVLSSPRVDEPISGGKAVIRGQFTLDEVKALSIQLNAGALPVPVKVLEQRSIGATLGQSSVDKSIFAGAIGLFLVAVFMAFYYGRLGLLADVALLIYGLITLALYKLFGVVLTLPGVAGFILSMGMAVDANILIFERLREEIRLGRPLLAAIEMSFQRAWDSIRDANACTLIICFILFNPLNWSFLNSSGMVRGFALTLAVGVVISLFTGIVVSRNLIRLFYKGK
ncbi:MAG: protein translocase subunit SecD [Patescibacteria group bacterium]